MEIDFLKSNSVLYAGLMQSVRRSTADILEENEQGVFLRDTVGDAFMLATGNAELGMQWLIKHEDLEYSSLALFQRKLVDFAKKRYELPSFLDCFQAVYEKKEPPERRNNIRIREATEEDYKIISDNYKMLSEQGIKKVIERRDLFIGLQDQEIVGFIGQHLEGSMGLLEILPAHRGKGYGTELESYLIAHVLKKGLIPFCQVETDNFKSLNLQKKMGLSISDEHLYWLF